MVSLRGPLLDLCTEGTVGGQLTEGEGAVAAMRGCCAFVCATLMFSTDFILLICREDAPESVRAS